MAETNEEKWINQINQTSSDNCFLLHDARIAELDINVLTNQDNHIPTSQLLYNQGNINIAGLEIDTIGTGTKGTRVITTEDLLNSLGLSNAIHYIGISTTSIIDGGSQKPTINGKQVTPSNGDIVLYKGTNTSEYQEFIWNGNGDNPKWELLGDESVYKIKQTAKSSPTTNGNTLAFIDTISQNENGVITATKKNITTISSSAGITTAATGLPTGSAIANYIINLTNGYQEAITSITRSGTTFTYTRIDGTTGSFTQQDNNTWNALSTAQAGYVKQAPNDTTQFLRGDATWAKISYNDLNNKPTIPQYTAGSGISINNNEISCTITPGSGGMTQTEANGYYVRLKSQTTTTGPQYIGTNLVIDSDSEQNRSIYTNGYLGLIDWQESYNTSNVAKAGFYLHKTGNNNTDLEIQAWNISANSSAVNFKANKVFNAVFNDYAEYRETKSEIEPGRVVREVGDGTLEMSTERLQRGCMIVSDTFGTSMGQTEKCNTPVAVAGRALAYCLEGRDYARHHIGWPVCAAPGGMISVMTEAEEAKYPSRIIGIISEIPNYDTWGTDNVKVNNRIWIKVM